MSFFRCLGMGVARPRICTSSASDAPLLNHLPALIDTSKYLSKTASTLWHPFRPSGEVKTLYCFSASWPKVDAPPDFIIWIMAMASTRLVVDIPLVV